MNCWYCGSQLIWDNDFSLEDFGGEGEGIVSVHHCSNCCAEVYWVLNFDEEEND